MNSLFAFNLGILFIILAAQLMGRFTKLIELHVLVDKEGRIAYTGSYNELKSKQTDEYKLIKLEGVLK